MIEIDVRDMPWIVWNEYDERTHPLPDVRLVVSWGENSTREAVYQTPDGSLSDETLMGFSVGKVLNYTSNIPWVDLVEEGGNKFPIQRWMYRRNFDRLELN